MATPLPVDPVKYFAGVLWAESRAREEAVARLEAAFGAVDRASADVPFDVTDYYAPKMGAGLHRCLISFAVLRPPEDVREAKLLCNRIEGELARERGRTVNLDIGYLDHNKVVLASVKAAGQKIHLGEGVYADLVARYRGGVYVPFEWTFPDFKDGRYDDDLLEMRRLYLGQRRE